MKSLIQLWESSFYTDLILFIIAIITFTFSCISKNKLIQLKLIQIYLITFILLFTNSYCYHLSIYNKLSYPSLIKIELTEAYIVSLFEYISFSHFLYAAIQNKKFKRVIKVISIILIFTFLITYVKSTFYVTDFKYQKIHSIYILESSALLIFCSFYFIELFKSLPIFKVTDSPNFWVSSGLMLYLIGTFPITIIMAYIHSTDLSLYRNLYSIIYIFYVLLFLSIIRAYKCKPSETI